MITYLAGAFTSEDKMTMVARHELHCFAASELMEEGEVVFAPIPHSYNIARYVGRLVDHDFWMQQCLPILQMCDRLVVIKDPAGAYNSSMGTQEEIKYATELDIPIEYRRF